MRRRWALTLVAGVSLLVLVGQSQSATDASAKLSVEASFDRKSVLPGQVAVFETSVLNAGPDDARGVTVELRVEGATLVSARTLSGTCESVQPSLRRCTLAPVAAGTPARIVAVAKPKRANARILGSARIANRSTSDPSAAVDRDIASAFVRGEPVSRSYTEISFVLESPSTVVAGRAFTAVLRLLNRGPASATVGRVSITPAPSAPIVLSRAPGTLSVGEERAVIARITPARAGPLRLNVRVGRSGTHVARLFVRAA
jgi:hypothetical protein